MREVQTAAAMLVLLLAAVSCAQYDAEVRVADIKKAEVLVLRKEPSEGHVVSISVRGRGSLDGEARISLVLNGDPYKTEHLRGKVDFRWGGDWYSNSAEIRYEPITVQSGEVTIAYRFSTLK